MHTFIRRWAKKAKTAHYGFALVSVFAMLFVAACDLAGGSSSTTNTGGNGSGGTSHVVPPPAPAPGSGYSGPTLPTSGFPGIQPSAPGHTPAFSQDEVLTFIRAHGIPGTGGNTDGTVTHNELLSPATIADLIKDPTILGFGDGPLWYLELKGHFSFQGPSSIKQVTAGAAYEIFDPHTGNLLGEGGLPDATPPVQSTPPPVQSTPTPKPNPVIKFFVRPLDAKQTCSGSGPLAPLSFTLDNTGSNVDVQWQAGIIDLTPGTSSLWANATPANGTVAAGSTATLTLTPDSTMCQHLQQSQQFRAQVTLVGATGTFMLTDTIAPFVIG